MSTQATAPENKRAAGRRRSPRLPLAEIGFTLGTVALVAAIMLAIPELRHAIGAAVRGDTTEVRDQVNGLGVAGPLIIIALCIAHTVAFYPAEIVDAASGFVYGFFPGLALVMVGWMISGLLAYAIGRSVARPLLDRFLGAERFQRIETTISRGGVVLLLAVRLIPVFPFSIVCYAAGAARVPLWRYIWTTAVGFIPITAMAVYLGTRLEGLSLTDPLVLAAGGGLVLLLLGGNWIYRRQTAGAREAAASDDGGGTRPA